MAFDLAWGLSGGPIMGSQLIQLEDGLLVEIEASGGQP